MRVALTQIEAQLTAAASRWVVPAEAAHFAACYLRTHLRKAPRMNPLGDAVADLKNWAERPDARVTVARDQPGLALVDFDGLAPSLKLLMIHDLITAKARAQGLAAVGFGNAGGVITLGTWSDALADRGLIGIALYNGGNHCAVVPGGRRGILGTTPLSYAIPTGGQPLLLDMATTEIPYFQVKNAKAKGEPLPPGAALDQRGLPTTDAAQAITDDGVSNLLPMGGGMKGFGIMMLVEVLTGALLGRAMANTQTPGWHPTDLGCLLLAIDPAAFGDAARYVADMDRLVADLRAQEPAEGSAGIVLPGDRALGSEAAARAAGAVEIDDAVAADLAALAG